MGAARGYAKKSWRLDFLRDSNTNYVLINNCGTNTLQNENPTEAEIHAAIFALDTKKGQIVFLSRPDSNDLDSGDW